MKAIPNSVWKVSNPARSTYTQDGAVILDIQKGLCYSLRSIDRTVRSEPPRARTSSARSALHRVRWKSLRQALRDAAEPNAQRRDLSWPQFPNPTGQPLDTRRILPYESHGRIANLNRSSLLMLFGGPTRLSLSVVASENTPQSQPAQAALDPGH